MGSKLIDGASPIGGDFGGSVAGGGGSPIGGGSGGARAAGGCGRPSPGCGGSFNWRRRFVDQYGFAVTEMLFGQRQPRVRHGEQGAFVFDVSECLSECEAFLGI